MPAGERPLRELYEARNHDRALRRVERWPDSSGRAVPVPTPTCSTSTHVWPTSTRPPGPVRSHRVLIAGTGFVPPGQPHASTSLMPALLALASRPALTRSCKPPSCTTTWSPSTRSPTATAGRPGILMNYHLLRRGPLAVIEVTRRGEYLAALDAANAGAVEPFARFVADSRTIRSPSARLSRPLRRNGHGAANRTGSDVQQLAGTSAAPRPT